jgi:hypothetical protein
VNLLSSNLAKVAFGWLTFKPKTVRAAHYTRLAARESHAGWDFIE